MGLTFQRHLVKELIKVYPLSQNRKMLISIGFFFFFLFRYFSLKIFFYQSCGVRGNFRVRSFDEEPWPGGC